MRHRRIIVAGGAALLLLATFGQHPTADIRIITHDTADTAPRKVQAAVDLGVAAISVLVTWSATVSATVSGRIAR